MSTYFETLKQLSVGRVMLSPNEILYKEGGIAKEVYGIHQGSLIVYKNDRQSKFLFPRFVKSGQVLPLNALQSGFYRDTAQALTSVEAYLIEDNALKTLLHKDVPLRLLVMQEICKEISKVESHDLNHYNKSLKQKTAHILLEMIKSCGEEGVPDYCYRLIPDLLEATEKNWNKVLDELAREGLIMQKGHKILVTNPEKMKKIV